MRRWIDSFGRSSSRADACACASGCVSRTTGASRYAGAGRAPLCPGSAATSAAAARSPRPGRATLVGPLYGIRRGSRL